MVKGKVAVDRAPPKRVHKVAAGLQLEDLARRPPRQGRVAHDYDRNIYPSHPPGCTTHCH